MFIFLIDYDLNDILNSKIRIHEIMFTYSKRSEREKAMLAHIKISITIAAGVSDKQRCT